MLSLHFGLFVISLAIIVGLITAHTFRDLLSAADHTIRRKEGEDREQRPGSKIKANSDVIHRGLTSSNVVDISTIRSLEKLRNDKRKATGVRKGLALRQRKNVHNYSRTEIISSYGPKLLPFMRYLHIPKTGTSFAALVVHYCCDKLDDVYINVLTRLNSNVPMPWKQDETCKERLKQPISSNGNWWSHIPYRPSEDRERVVTMFRSPASRIASQIVHMSTLKGLMTTFGVTKMDASILSHVFFRRLDKALKMRDIVLDYYTNLYNDKGTISKSGDTLTNQDNDAAFKWNFGSSNFILKPSNYSVLFSQFDKFFKALLECKSEKERDPTKSSPASKFCHLTSVLYYPGLLNCQCKMALGYPCADKLFFPFAKVSLESDQNSFEIHPDVIGAVQDSIHNNFKFSGIQERWNESIHKFHTKYGGSYFKEENDITRRGSPQFDGARAFIEEAYNKHHIMHDQCDHLIYNEAVKWLDALPSKD